MKRPTSTAPSTALWGRSAICFCQPSVAGVLFAHRHRRSLHPGAVHGGEQDGGKGGLHRPHRLFKAFKRDFKQSTALWLVLLLAGFAALTGLRTATAQDTPSTGILAAASFLLLVLAGCCGSWGFALLARFTYPGVLPVLADSGRMTLANLLPTVGNLAFLAWFPLLAKAAPAWFVYLLPLWLLIGGAGSALGMASLMRPAFAQLEKAGRKEEEPEEEPDTEDSVQ